MIGLGNTGLAMVSMLKGLGEVVYGYNRKGKTTDNLRNVDKFEVAGLECDGFSSDFIVDDIEQAVSQVDLIFVCIPATEHHDLSKQLEGLGNIPPVVLLPGRVFGAFNFKTFLPDSIVVEAQSVPHAARYLGEGRIEVYATKKSIQISSLELEEALLVKSLLPEKISQMLVTERNYMEATLSSIGMVLHCAPMVFNSGLISNKSGLKFYKDLISEDIANYMTQIDQERLDIGRELNLNLGGINQWLQQQYSANQSDGLYSALQSIDCYAQIEAPNNLNHRYLNEDLVYGLFPLEVLGSKLGLETPYITNLIDSANLLVKKDFREQYQGRIPDLGKMK